MLAACASGRRAPLPLCTRLSLGTVVIIEHLPRLGQERLDVLPAPRGPITDDAQAPLLCRHPAGRVELREGLAALLLIVPLMPTAPLDEALPIDAIPAQTCGIPPRAAPPCPLGPMAALAGTAPRARAGRVGTEAPSRPHPKTGRRQRPAATSAMRRSISERDGATSTPVRCSATWCGKVCRRSLPHGPPVRSHKSAWAVSYGTAVTNCAAACCRSRCVHPATTPSASSRGDTPARHARQ